MLSTADAALGDATGIRFAAAADVFSNSFDLEFVYTGLLDWSSTASVNSVNNDLHSVFSDFGTNPTGGFLETDQANFHAISYGSELNSFELNTKFRWCHTTTAMTGAWIAGVRYLRLSERLRHVTRADAHVDPLVMQQDPNNPTMRGPGDLDYLVALDNDMVGFVSWAPIHVFAVADIPNGPRRQVGHLWR